MSEPAPLHPARRLWQLIEPIHAVTYFAPRCLDEMKALGLKGFWMGYFAGRAAPMGPVGPALVESTFANFASKLVHRAIPDAWGRARPDAVLAARSRAAADVLREVRPGIEADAPRITPLLASAVRAGHLSGRPLFAANQALPLPDDPVEALWQCCTALREHRGDGHVAVLVAAGLTGLEAHLLAGMEVAMLDVARGWSEADVNAAHASLVERDLMDGGWALTAAGRALKDRIEVHTDEAALQPWRDGLTQAGFDLVPTLLRPIADAVLDAGLLPFPNPIGLPRR